MYKYNNFIYILPNTQCIMTVRFEKATHSSVCPQGVCFGADNSYGLLGVHKIVIIVISRDKWKMGKVPGM